MFRATILIIGIIWASLLLISWGGAEDLSPANPATVTSHHSTS